MTKMQRILVILTGLLVLTGLIILISGNPLSLQSETAFDDERAYEDARGSGTVAKGAPDLPACAQDVEVEESEGRAARISFVCANAKERATFVAYVKNEFSWNLYEQAGGKIILEAPEQP